MKTTLTNGEVSALKAIVENNGCLINGHGYEDNGFVLEEAAKGSGISVKSMKGFCSSLQKKGLVNMYNDAECYFSGQLTESGIEAWKEIKAQEDEEFNKPVMDSRIVSLNEIVAKKLPGISKGKRDNLKNAKAAAKGALDNWENLTILKNIVTDEELLSRESGNEFLATVLEQVRMRVQEIKEKAKPKQAKAETTKAKPKTEKTDNVKGEGKKRGIKPIKEWVIGDHHPKHPTWVWTEYKPGKFDWRTDKALKPKKESTAADKPTEKKTIKAKAKKAQEKQETPKAEPTMQEFLERVARKGKKGISKPMEDILKSLRKGYEIKKINNSLFLHKDGENKSLAMDSFTALLKRYGIDEMPQSWVK